MPVIEPEPLAPPVTPGPCDWPLNTDCCPGWDAATVDQQTAATAWATEILDSLTGHRFAQCAVNYRPCGPRCVSGFGYLAFPVGSPQSGGGGLPWMTPYVDAGVWRNCGCAGGCSCRAACEIPFPTSVAQVTEVLIDGLTLDPSAYRLDAYKGTPVLVRIDGDCWPQCQDMALDADADGAFTIVYQPGEPLPEAGKIAAGMLACEFLKACQGGACVLPQQLASMVRNGVEIQVVDPSTLLENGLTGIAHVDLWVRSVNPHQKPARSRVYSPDTVGPRYSS